MVYGKTTGTSAFTNDNLEVLAWLPAVIFIAVPWLLMFLMLLCKILRHFQAKRAIRSFDDPDERTAWRRRHSSAATDGVEEVENAATEGKELKKMPSQAQSGAEAGNAFSMLEQHRRDHGEDDEMGSTPPAYAVTLTFKDLEYSVPVGSPLKLWRRDKLHILKGAEGWIKSGELTAIMGSSGGGKTTLMNALTGRTKGGVVSGDIRVNGRKPVPSFFLQTGFVYQFEVLTPELTVRETLGYAASLMLPPHMSSHDRFMAVENVLREVGLTHVANNRIGSELHPGISGGQLKRVGIAVELLRNPAVLFLDEPTSGLDALTSLSLLQTLQSLARSGRAIAFTIHQPRSEIFEMFDTLILVKAGKIAFHGSKQQTVAFLSGLSRRNHTYYANLGDFVADTLCAPANSTYGLMDKYDCHQMFLESAHGSLICSKIRTIHKHSEVFAAFPDIAPPKVAFMTQALCLASRMWDVYVRRPDLFITELVRAAGTAIILGLGFWQLGDSYLYTNARNGLTFFITTYVLLNSALGVSTYHEHIKVFQREHATGMVSSHALLAAASIVDIPRETFFTLIFGTITFVMTAIGSSFEEYVYFILVIVIAGVMSTSFFATVAVLSRDQVVANIVWVMVLTVMSLFSGFLMASGEIPDWLQWSHYLAFHSWVYGGLLDVVFGSRSINFVPTSPSCDLVTTQVALCNANSCSSFSQTCPSSGTSYIEFIQMDHMNRYICLIFCTGMALFFRCLSYILLDRITLRRTFKIKLHEESDIATRQTNTAAEILERARAMKGTAAKEGIAAKQEKSHDKADKRTMGKKVIEASAKVDQKTKPESAMGMAFVEKGRMALKMDDTSFQKLKQAKLPDVSVNPLMLPLWRFTPFFGGRRVDKIRDVEKCYRANYDQVERILNYSDGGTRWMRALFKIRTKQRQINQLWAAMQGRDGMPMDIPQPKEANKKRGKGGLAAMCLPVGEKPRSNN